MATENQIKEFRKLFDEKEGKDFPLPQFSGKGIVTTAGGHCFICMAYASFKLLRHLGCTLPIEWFYIDDKEMPARYRKYIEDIGNVKLIKVDGIKQNSSYWKEKGGWQSKVKAIMQSSFKDVLFLDADCFCIKDPTYLFDETEFKQYGAFFMPDTRKWDTERWATLGEVFGVDFNPEHHEFESSVIMVDKDRCWKALNLVDFINGHSDLIYEFVYGDKDTFYFGFRKAKKDYFINRGSLIKAGGLFIHRDYKGFPLFRHLTGAKFSTVSGGWKHNHKLFPYTTLAYSYMDRMKQIHLKEKLPEPQEVKLSDICIMVSTCEKYKDRAKAVLETWGRGLDNLYFIVDKPMGLPNEVVTGFSTYHELSQKSAFMWDWASKQNYKWFIKIDDDSYLWTDRLVKELCKYDHRTKMALGDLTNMSECANWWDIYWISGGAGIVLSKPVLAYISGNTPEKYAGMEDVWLSDILIGLKVPMLNVPGMCQYFDDNVNFEKLISLHELNPEDLYALDKGEKITARYRIRTRDYLPAFFEKEGYRVGVEVGVWEGEFSEHILKHWSGKLYSVDPLKEDKRLPNIAMVNLPQEKLDAIYATAISRLSKYGDRSVFVRKSSIEASKDFEDGSLDFVYIDGLHYYDNVIEDIKAWIPKIRKGGIISGHDYYEDTWGCAVRKAVDMLVPNVSHTLEKRASVSWYKIIE